MNRKGQMKGLIQRQFKLLFLLMSLILVLGFLGACNSSPTSAPPENPAETPNETPSENPGETPSETPNPSPESPPPSSSPFANASSLTSCTNTRGAEALYWDFMVGVIRVDYPETVRLIPYAPGIPFIHPVQPLYNFIYPAGWQADTLTDASSQLTGVNVIRQDGQAVWRRLNLTVSGTVTPQQVIDNELSQMRSRLSGTESVEVVCFLESQDKLAAALLVRTGAYTANITAQVFPSSFLGNPVSTIFIQRAFSPTAQYETEVVNTFFPLSGQMNLGGGSSDPECSDGIDNDGDGQTDYPDDKGCTSKEDTSESGG
ncbi:MAG: hypothetical protein KC422_10875 [Trueperaceae bacterium]|nr:hypothetical protein [Trueperaceae bacterium]